MWTVAKRGLSKQIKLKYLDLIIFFALFLLSLGVRSYKLEEVTPGMWGDEIVTAQVGERLIDTKDFAPFVTDNYGHSTPLLYLTGWLVKIFGRSLTSVRLVSVIFGSLNVSLMYIFLRLFFQKQLAILGSLIMTFTYSHIIISRFNYEITPAMLFEIFSLIYLVIIYKGQDVRKYAALGLIIAGGLYTYLGFRTFALVLLALALLISYRLGLKKCLQRISFLLGFLIIGLLPLLSYSLHHPDQITARTKSVSVFNQNLSKIETIKEIIGSAKRSFGMFTSYGDPNPRQNPAGRTMFDPLTSSLVLVGLVSLFVRKRKIFIACLILMLPAFVNDIFSAEFFPEFHYYGTGHPNILRVAGIIPIIIFLAIYGINTLQEKIADFSKYSKYFAFVIVIIICFINFNWYYSQPYSDFNYYINGVPQLKIIDYIKKNNFTEVLVTKELAEDIRIQYFKPENIKLSVFTPDGEKGLEQIPKGVPLFIDSKVSTNFVQLLTNQENMLKYKVLLDVKRDPLGRTETVVIYRN
jgi:hypothetical protein